jgi:hypothetical protein
MDSEIAVPTFTSPLVIETGGDPSDYFYRHFTLNYYLPSDHIARTVRLRKRFGMCDARDYLHDEMLIKLSDRSIHAFNFPYTGIPFDLEKLCSAPDVTTFEAFHDVLVMPPSVWPTTEYTPGCILKAFGRNRTTFMLCYEDGTIRALISKPFIVQIATKNVVAYVRQYLCTEQGKLITNTHPDDVAALFGEDGSLLAYLRDIKLTDS